MFTNCTNFNCDLSTWVVSKGKKFTSMFYRCKEFNCDLS
ncbi:BspA family leucine-rich repeat surface protein [bacterium]|nr:BspA family leucine-rich repeat surface protein [bacterium]